MTILPDPVAAFVKFLPFTNLPMSAMLPACHPAGIGPIVDLLEMLREQGRCGVVHAHGPAPFALSNNRLEVHEPGLEKGLGYGFQSAVHPPVQLDLVIQCTKDAGDSALLNERGRSLLVLGSIDLVEVLYAQCPNQML